jgi:cation transport ATPase
MLVFIAAISLVGIILHLMLRFFVGFPGSLHGIPVHEMPLLVVLLLGGAPLTWGLLQKLRMGEFGSDLLAGLSIVTSVILGEYLAGALVVLMLSGGGVLEAFAVRSASSVLAALAKRMPSIAHRKVNDHIEEWTLDRIAIGDILIVLPHEICPVDGIVVNGHGSMDESYLTGEPYVMSKAPGSNVLSGAINGESALLLPVSVSAIRLGLRLRQHR